MACNAYDLDGVLAEAPAPAEKSFFKSNGAERRARKEYLLDFHAKAQPLFVPPEDNFSIITARKDVAPIKSVTIKWLMDCMPAGKVFDIAFLREGRTIKNVVAFKTRRLIEIDAQEFTEDNEKVLKGIRKNLPNIKLWLYKDGERHIYP